MEFFLHHTIDDPESFLGHGLKGVYALVGKAHSRAVDMKFI